MPAPVGNAVASLVMPLSLCTAFRQTRSYPVLINVFANGESLREIEATNSRRSWELSRRLLAEDLDDLRQFFDDLQGGLRPFFYYDPFESDPLFNYDETGASLNGRFTARFTSAFQQSIRVGVGEVSLAFIELSASLSDGDLLQFDKPNASGQILTLGL